MTTRKPKLNLLYASDSSMPWPRLQLAVVETEPNPSAHHARQWHSVRFAGATQPSEATALAPLKH
jgi:hypothetical protein